MTLLVTVIAAVICTVIWYRTAPKDTMKVSTLCFIYGGASLMWLVDAIFEYAQLHADFFTSSVQDMINDTFLGISSVTLGLVIWLVRLLSADPKNVLKKYQKKEN